MIACVACARALSVCRKRRGKKKELSQEARARDQKKRGSFLPLRKPLSLSLSRGGHGGGNFFKSWSRKTKVTSSSLHIRIRTVLKKTLPRHSHFHFNRGKKCLRWDTRKDCRVKKTSVGR